MPLEEGDAESTKEEFVPAAAGAACDNPVEVTAVVAAELADVAEDVAAEAAWAAAASLARRARVELSMGT